ncbi:MAG: hypothetical protein ACRC5A_10040 [Enterobacteriaceae bacterium]
MGFFGQNIIRDFAPRTPKAKAESEGYEALLIALVTEAARQSGDATSFINGVDKEMRQRLSHEGAESARKLCARMLDIARDRTAG